MVKPDLELKVGRRQADGTIKLSPLGHELVQISVSYKGERSSSVVLTRSQVATLRQALAEYELSLKTSEQEPDGWNRTERRVL